MCPFDFIIQCHFHKLIDRHSDTEQACDFMSILSVAVSLAVILQIGWVHTGIQQATSELHIDFKQLVACISLQM